MVLDMVIIGLAITPDPDAPNAAVTIFGDTAAGPPPRWLAGLAAPLTGLDRRRMGQSGVPR